MESLYKVITEGRLREGYDPEQFVEAFSQAFKIPAEQVRKLLEAGRPVTLKDGIEKHTAEKFREVLSEQMGLEVRIEAKHAPLPGGDLSLEGDSGSTEAAEAPAESVASKDTATPNATVRCPKCGSDQVSGDDCLACGVIISRYLARQAEMVEQDTSPYAAPTSRVLPDETERESGDFELRKLGPESAWQWIVGGWRLFVRNPLTWIGTIIIWYGMMLVANFIPIIGPLAANILAPVFTAGIMLGANDQREGSDFTVGHLFAGFSREFGKLVVVGLLTLAASLVLVLVVVLFGFGAFVSQSNGGSPSPVSVLLLVFIAVTFFAVMTMAFLYVPMLVVFDGHGPVDAIKLSFAACWKNAIPFLIYGAIVFGLALVAIIPVGLGFVVLAPVIMASLYVSYRSIFYGDV